MLLFTTVLALFSLGLSLALWQRVQQLQRQITRPARSLDDSFPVPLLTPVEGPARPLEGLSISLDVQQDHPHPLFANFVAELLQKEDVARVSLTPDEGADIQVVGHLTCNGYSDIYYEAEFECSSRGRAICVVIERPPHGDRPANLALELVSKLKVALRRSSERIDRQRAIQELHEP